MPKRTGSLGRVMVKGPPALPAAGEEVHGPVPGRSVMGPLVLISAVLIVPPAWAANPGWNLSWTDCGASGQANRSFTCDSNSGVDRIVCSLVAPPGPVSSQIVELGFLAVVSFACGSAGPLPPWWQFAAGGCREGALRVDLDSSWGPSCPSMWRGGEIVETTYSPDTCRATLSIGIVVPPDSSAIALVPGQEYFAFEILIDHSKTSGAPVCDGCQAPAVINRAIGQINSDTGSQDLSGAARDTVYWQRGSVPTRTASWGAVKTMYR
jgi:hypothetical protein